MIEVIAIIVIIVNDILVMTVVTDDDNVPVSQEPYEDLGMILQAPAHLMFLVHMTLLHLFLLCCNVPWLSFAPCRYQPISRTWLVIVLPKHWEISSLIFDEAILMCMGPSKRIRFGSFCISTPEVFYPCYCDYYNYCHFYKLLIFFKKKLLHIHSFFFWMRAWCSWSSGQACLYVSGWPVFEFHWEQ